MHSMKYARLITLALLLLCHTVFSGINGFVTNPFEHNVFIENKGQFDKIDKRTCSRILFGGIDHGVQIYFTAKGLTYHFDKTEFPEEKENERKENEAEREMERVKNKKIYSYTLDMEWEGADPEVKLISENIATEYYCYGDDRSSFKASAYKKLIYKNVYPGIDVEYIFHEQGGLKYTLTLQPGADISKIKMKYKNAKSITPDRLGNIIIKSDFGNFTDHTPFSFYESDRSVVNSSFNVNGDEVGFTLNGNYDRSKTLIIDPWLTNPNFSIFNSAYEVEYDLSGNVYVYGGSLKSPQLIKFNSGGVIQWVYSLFSENYHGDIATDEVSGTTYYSDGFGGNGSTTGARMFKINTAGNLTGSFAGFGATMLEIIRLDYNRCINKLIIGGGGTAQTNQSAILDTNFNVIISPKNAVASCCPFNDINLLAQDDYDPNYFYFIPGIPTSGSTAQANKLFKAPVSTIIPSTFSVPTGYGFVETGNANYFGTHNSVMGTTSNTRGFAFNGIAISPNFVYTYDGSILKKWNKTTGAFIAQVNTGGTIYSAGGLAADDCDNVYAGVGNYLTNAGSIKEYNSALSQINTFSVPNTPVDLKLAPNNTLYACGIGFVKSFSTIVSCPKPPLTLTVNTIPVSCGAGTNNGTATATVTGGSGSYSYLWSNGQTTQTATGLAAGTYTVFVSDNSIPGSCLGSGKGAVVTSTVTITTTTGLAVSSTSASPICNGANNGVATISVTGGTSPYTYSWSPSGKTGASATGLNAGAYTVSVTDASGCTIKTILTITQSAPFTISATGKTTSCGANNGTATVATTGTGMYTYSWNPIGGVGSQAQSLINTPPGIYTVIVTELNTGCVKTDTAIIAASVNTVTATFTQSPTGTICAGTMVNFTNTGSTGTNIFHYWSVNTPSIKNGNTIAFSYTFLTAGTYTITQRNTDGTCWAVVTSTVTVVNCSGTIVTATGSSVCSGSCASVTSSASNGTGPYTYLWNTGATTQNINPCPASTTTYTVTISDNTGATATSTAIATINPTVTATTTPTNITCDGGTNGSVLATGSNGTLPYTYSWSNGFSGSSVSGLSSGIYSVSITDSKGCTATSVATILSPPALLGQFSKGTANCTACGCKQWLLVSATGGTSPYSYTWPDGYVKRYKNQLCPGAYNIQITDKNGCNIYVLVNAP
ncbi:MAG: SprB repeat-containing protein [Bacteroidetes bacterium]|nr:SprB repeat-containing protein [Bacteroidota bacterium]